MGNAMFHAMKAMNFMWEMHGNAMNNLNLDLSKSNSFTFKVALHPSKFSALHSQQGYLDAQWGSHEFHVGNAWKCHFYPFFMSWEAANL